MPKLNGKVKKKPVMPLVIEALKLKAAELQVDIELTELEMVEPKPPRVKKHRGIKSEKGMQKLPHHIKSDVELAEMKAEEKLRASPSPWSQAAFSDCGVTYVEQPHGPPLATHAFGDEYAAKIVSGQIPHEDAVRMEQATNEETVAWGSTPIN